MLDAHVTESSFARQVEGSHLDQQPQAHHYLVQGAERSVRFRVMREELHGERGWAVRIEGVPGPSIVHERPWRSVEAARDAAMKAIGIILSLEQRQREELEPNRP